MSNTLSTYAPAIWAFMWFTATKGKRLAKAKDLAKFTPTRRAPISPGFAVTATRAFEEASGRPVPYEIVARRPGDVAACYADPSHALEVLGWKAERGLKEMCEDAWRWQSQNPDGYGA